MATTKKFDQDVLDGICYGLDGYRRISNEIIDHRRWSVTHELLFEELETGNVYQVFHERPATESQEVEEWDVDEDGMVECTLMKPVEVTVTKYVVAE